MAVRMLFLCQYDLPFCLTFSTWPIHFNFCLIYKVFMSNLWSMTEQVWKARNTKNVLLDKHIPYACVHTSTHKHTYRHTQPGTLIPITVDWEQTLTFKCIFLVSLNKCYNNMYVNHIQNILFHDIINIHIGLPKIRNLAVRVYFLGCTFCHFSETLIK